MLIETIPTTNKPLTDMFARLNAAMETRPALVTAAHSIVSDVYLASVQYTRDAEAYNAAVAAFNSAEPGGWRATASHALRAANDVARAIERTVAENLQVSPLSPRPASPVLAPDLAIAGAPDVIPPHPPEAGEFEDLVFATVPTQARLVLSPGVTVIANEPGAFGSTIGGRIASASPLVVLVRRGGYYLETLTPDAPAGALASLSIDAPFSPVVSPAFASLTGATGGALQSARSRLVAASQFPGLTGAQFDVIGATLRIVQSAIDTTPSLSALVATSAAGAASVRMAELSPQGIPYLQPWRLGDGRPDRSRASTALLKRADDFLASVGAT